MDVVIYEHKYVQRTVLDPLELDLQTNVSHPK